MVIFFLSWKEKIIWKRIHINQKHHFFLIQSVSFGLLFFLIQKQSYKLLV